MEKQNLGTENIPELLDELSSVIQSFILQLPRLDVDSALIFESGLDHLVRIHDDLVSAAGVESETAL